MTAEKTNFNDYIDFVGGERWEKAIGAEVELQTLESGLGSCYNKLILKFAGNEM